MISSNMKVGGLLTFWTTGEYSNLAIMQDSLAGLGLSAYAPQARTPAAALRDALQEVFTGRDHKVEALEERDAFEVIKITRGKLANVYDNLLTAKIETGTIKLVPYNDHAERIGEEYNRHLGKVRGPAVTESLVKILKHLGGTPLRPKGGVYWLCDTKADLWAKVAAVAERSASLAARPNNVYLIRHEMDSDAMRAVRDAIVTEITAETERLHAEAINAELGEKATQNRKERAKSLRTKIKEYEEILGCELNSLTEAVEKAEEAYMIEALVESGAGD